MTTSDRVTELLLRWPEGGDIHDRLMPLVYRDLRAIAGSLFARERRDHTLAPTILVTEAYLRMVGGGPWRNRAHFFGAAARSMRRILVDHARRRNADKRGGCFEHIPLDCVTDVSVQECSEILTMHEALQRLRQLHPRRCRIVELRYFAGLSVEETAEALELGTSTIKAEWMAARAWLKEHLEGS